MRTAMSTNSTGSSLTTCQSMSTGYPESTSSNRTMSTGYPESTGSNKTMSYTDSRSSSFQSQSSHSDSTMTTVRIKSSSSEMNHHPIERPKLVKQENVHRSSSLQSNDHGHEYVDIEEPGQMPAHPIAVRPNRELMPFWSDDNNAPSFLPNDPAALAPKVTPSWENPIAESQFPGQVVFEGSQINSQPVIEMENRPTDRIAWENVNDRCIPLPSSSSSSSSGSSEYNHYPLPPRIPTSAPIVQDVRLRPAAFQVQQQPSRLQQLSSKIKNSIKQEKR